MPTAYRYELPWGPIPRGVDEHHDDGLPILHEEQPYGDTSCGLVCCQSTRGRTTVKDGTAIGFGTYHCTCNQSLSWEIRERGGHGDFGLAVDDHGKDLVGQ